MQLNPYLGFAGDCESAFRFYQQCLGGEITAMIPYADIPECEGMASDWLGKIAHARLLVDGHALMGSDSPPEHQEETRGMSLTLTVDTADEAERLFAALAADGTVRMPLEETSWAQRFGMLVDRFGIPWMVNCEKTH